MTSQEIAQEIRRIEREIQQFKAELYDRLVALDHLRPVHAAAQAQEQTAHE